MYNIFSLPIPKFKNKNNGRFIVIVIESLLEKLIGKKFKIKNVNIIKIVDINIE